MGELRKIPNVGKMTEERLNAMGYTTIDSLKGTTADRLYAEECAMRNETVDRCQLYLYRAVVYFVNSDAPDPTKCSWWLWKDEFYESSPCGAVCAECRLFPATCSGCRKIRGKPYWLKYTGDAVCKVYDCCVKKNGRTDCGKCDRLPCDRFTKDPTISDEQNAANLRRMLDRLRR